MKMLCSILLILIVMLGSPKIVLATDSNIEFSDIIENHGSIMLMIDAETGEILFANTAAQRFYGYSENEIEAMFIQDINTLSDEEVANERLRAAQEERNHFIFKHRLANGEIRVVEVYAYPYTYGGRTALFSIIQDVTSEVLLQEQKATLRRYYDLGTFAVITLLVLLSVNLYRVSKKHKLEKQKVMVSEKFTQAIIDSIRGVVYRCKDDEQMTVEYLSKGCYQLTGYQPEAFVNNKMSGFRELLSIKHRLHSLVSTDVQYEYEYEIKTKNSEVKWVLDRGRTYKIENDEVLRWEGTLTDITPLKTSQKNVSEIKEQLRLVTDNISEVVWLNSEDNKNFVFINRAFEDIWGFKRDDMYKNPETFMAAIHTVDQPAVFDAWQKHLNNAHLKIECRIVRPDGQIRWILMNSKKIHDTHGTMIGYVGSAIDITVRKQLEEKIMASSVMYQSVVDTQQEMIVRYLPDTTITFVNDAYCRIFGVKRSDLLGQKYLMLIPIERHEEELASIKRLSISNKSDLRLHEMKFADGSSGWLEWKSIALFNEFGEITEIQGVGNDVTKQKQAEMNMLHAYDKAIEGWVHALDLKDKETEGHSRRVTELTLLMAQKMGIEDSELAHIRRGALLHDIGKMGIPDKILLKPGKLSDEEFAIVRKHPVYAYEMLSPIHFLHPALDIPYSHHEKWDGSGYPRKLIGEQIPLTARIFAVIDVYDALTSDRPYRDAWTREKTLEYIQDNAGSHFDPMIVDVFLKVIAEFDAK